MKSGCSTAGCHTANVTISGEMQVGEQARHFTAQWEVAG